MLGVKQVMIPLSDRMGTKLRIEEDLNFSPDGNTCWCLAMQLEPGWGERHGQGFRFGNKSSHSALC